MKVEFMIPTIAVFDTIVSGIEGGIRNWAEVVRYRPVAPRDGDAARTHPRVACELRVIDTGEYLVLTDKWTAAVKLMAERHPRHFAAMLSGQGDAETGNVLVQLAAFGELVYG